MESGLTGIIAIFASIIFLLCALLAIWLLTAAARRARELSGRLFSEEKLSRDLSVKLAAAESELAAVERSRGELKADMEKSLSEKAELERRLAASLEKISFLEAKLAGRESDEKKLREQMSSDFELLSTRIFESARDKITRESGDKISLVLKPLRENIEEFRKRLEDLSKSAACDRASMGSHIKSLVDMNTRLSADAQNLTSALKGNNKVAGNWGEISLARIFEACGLVEGIHYESQKSYADTSGEQKRLIPDFLVKLPGGRAIVVDSKLSLLDYAAWIEADSQAQKRAALEKFKKSVRSHLDEFAGKYNAIPEANCGFKLMYMPIEGAWELLSREDGKIFADAYSKNVLIVNPASVMAVLKFSEIVVRNAALEKNTRDISNLAARFIERAELFSERFDSLGERIRKLSESYADADKTLRDSPKSLMNTAERLASKYRGDIGASSASNALEEEK